MDKKDNSLKSYLESVGDAFILDTLGQLMTNRLNSIVVTYELLEGELNTIVIEDNRTSEFIKESREEFENSTKDMREMIEFLRTRVNSNSLKDKDD